MQRRPPRKSSCHLHRRNPDGSSGTIFGRPHLNRAAQRAMRRPQDQKDGRCRLKGVQLASCSLREERVAHQPIHRSLSLQRGRSRTL